MEGEITDNRLLLKKILVDPELWFPIGYGEQKLYTYEFTLHDVEGEIDTRTKKIGFRRVKMLMNEGAWKKTQKFPQARSVPHVQMEINGVNIFCKGTNWVMPEIFYGTITDSRY